MIYPKASNNTEKLERKLASVGEVEGLVVAPLARSPPPPIP